jgi:hypothetical protein
VIEEADKDLWIWKDDVLRCNGKASRCRSKKVYTNFELILEWSCKPTRAIPASSGPRRSR